MGNTVPGTLTKLLTLIPILVAIYFYDFQKFLVVLTSVGLLSFFTMTVSLFALGVALKRRILAVRLQLSKISFTWGLCLLALAVLLYVYGSYAGDTAWYHFESLYVLIVAYVALRIGTGVLRALAPLLAILAFSLPPVGLFPDLLHQELTVFLLGDLIFVFFMIYVGLRIRAAIVPIAILSLGLFGWYTSMFALPIKHVYLDILVPLPLLVLLVPRIRRFASLPRDSLTPSDHEHRLFLNGFCSICGMRVVRAKVSENVGLWGLLAVLGVGALLILTTIPALGVVGGLPYDAYYTSQGYSGVITPVTPPGWQINSTAVYRSNSVLSPNFGTDEYAIKQVYVPVFHPESKNYTVYYELGYVAPPYNNGTFGQDITGWTITSNRFVQLGPFQGHLTAYTTSNRLMLAYQGTTSMLFLNGTKFEQYSVGLGFIRVFKNTNVNADSIQFLGDLNSEWLPGITTDSSFSGWTTFLYTLDQGVLFASGFLILASSVGVIVWIAYRANLYDERLDRFLTLASTQNARNWSALSGLLRLSHHAGTCQELAGASSLAPSSDTAWIDSSLKELEQRHLVGTSLVESGADIISVWRTAV